jgi:hypothetical protein
MAGFINFRVLVIQSAFESIHTSRLIRIYVTRLPLTVSDLPIMLKRLWGDSNRDTGCVASALWILTKKGENGWG